MLPALSLKRRRAQEAARWYARLNATVVASGDLEAFRAWRAKPEADRAFAEVERAWRSLGPLKSSPEVQAILAAPPSAASSAGPGWITFGLAAGGVAAVLGLAVVGIRVWTPSRQSYDTAIGSQQTVALSDGSRLTLDADTRVRVLPGPSPRHLILDRGRILAEVAPDPAHPFVVDAGSTRVTALGTAFSVRRNHKFAEVVLLHGRVDVRRGHSHLQLSPGQALESPSALPSAIDTADALAWTEGRIVLDHASPQDAVAEINRYATHPVRLDPSLASTAPVSGVFAEGDPDAFVQALSHLRGWRAEPQPDGSVLLVAAAPAVTR